MSNFNFGDFILLLIVAFIFDMLFAWPVMLLWNWLMPVIFGLKTITFWQAFGLNLLCSLLFQSNSSNSLK